MGPGQSPVPTVLSSLPALRSCHHCHTWPPTPPTTSITPRYAPTAGPQYGEPPARALGNGNYDGMESPYDPRYSREAPPSPGPGYDDDMDLGPPAPQPVPSLVCPQPCPPRSTLQLTPLSPHPQEERDRGHYRGRGCSPVQPERARARVRAAFWHLWVDTLVGRHQHAQQQWRVLARAST